MRGPSPLWLDPVTSLINNLPMCEESSDVIVHHVQMYMMLGVKCNCNGPDCAKREGEKKIKNRKNMCKYFNWASYEQSYGLMSIN